MDYGGVKFYVKLIFCAVSFQILQADMGWKNVCRKGYLVCCKYFNLKCNIYLHLIIYNRSVHESLSVLKLLNT